MTAKMPRCRRRLATPVTRAARKAVSRAELRAEVGQTAPDFDLPDQSGEPVRLSQLRGQKVVVYFDPKADTPGY